MQVLNREQSFLDLLSNSIANGISNNIDLFSQRKGFESLGLTKKQAKSVSNLDPRMQQFAIEKLLDINAGERFKKELEKKQKEQKAANKTVANYNNKGAASGETLPTDLSAGDGLQALGLSPNQEFLNQAMQDPSFSRPRLGLQELLQPGSITQSLGGSFPGSVQQQPGNGFNLDNMLNYAQTNPQDMYQQQQLQQQQLQQQQPDQLQQQPQPWQVNTDTMQDAYQQQQQGQQQQEQQQQMQQPSRMLGGVSPAGAIAENVDPASIVGMSMSEINGVLAAKEKAAADKRKELATLDKDAFDRRLKAHDKSAKEYEEMTQDYQDSVETMHYLEEMGKLINTGNLPNPSRAYIVKHPSGGKSIGAAIGAIAGGLGIGSPAMGAAAGSALGSSTEKPYKLSPEAQEFDKNSNLMKLSVAKQLAKGGRVTNEILKAAEGVVPKLINSPKANEKIINALAVEAMKKIFKYRSADKVMDKDGFRPMGFTSKVNKLTAKEVKKFNKEIKDNPFFVSKAPYKPATSSLWETIKETLNVAGEYQEEPEMYKQALGLNNGAKSYINSGVLNSLK